MSDGKITSIKFVVPPDGTDFGSAIPFEVKTEGLQEGARIDLRLCSSYRGTKNDGAGNISVTVKNGTAHGTCRVPLHPEWDNDPAEKQKRPLVDYWYVGTVSFTDISFPGEKIKVPTKESRQDFFFQYLSSPGDSPRGFIKGDTLRTPVPVNSTQLLHFHTTKSATESFRLHFQDDRMLFGKPLSLPINQKILEKGDPIYLLHSQFNDGTMGAFINSGNAARSSTSPTIQPGLKPVALPNGMKEEDPVIVMDLKGNAASAGLKQGKNNLSETSDWGKRILYESIYGSDIVPGAVAIKEAYPILKDFIKGGTFYIKTAKGHDYVIFRGWRSLRHIYKGSRYRLDNAKVASLTVAKGGSTAIKSVFQWSEGTTIAFVFVCSMDIVEWMNTDEGHKYFSDLLVDIGSDFTQTIASTAVGAIASFLVGKFITSSVFAVVGTGLGVSIGVGFLLTWLDDRFKLTEQAQEKVRQCNNTLTELVGYIFVKPFCNVLYQLEREAAAAQGHSFP